MTEKYKKGDVMVSINNFITDDQVNKMAVESGFQTRTPRKIFPVDFIRQLLEQSVKNSPSYNDLASSLEKDTGISVSKQAICLRVNKSCARFLELVLAKLIMPDMLHCHSQPRLMGKRYLRVLVQDSTIVRLPLRLFDAFSGVKNAHTSVCNARIQGVYDLQAAQFVSFAIDTYSKNDLAAAPELDLRAGDLVLRDRGYLTSGEIQRHIDAGADCIYRHKHKTIYLDSHTKEPIDLAAMLQKHGKLDCQVLLNNEQKTPVRLVAAPVNEETANLRRMKAKRESKGHSPSKSNLALMSWTIFITTIPVEKASFGEILSIYGLRWRIENIFKTWKSNMSFAAIHNVSENQLRTLLTARLSMLVIIFHQIYIPLRTRISTDFGKQLSMMKLLRYLQINPERIEPLIKLFSHHCHDNTLLSAIARYCVYDSRKKRLNYIQTEKHVFGLLALT